MRNAPDHGVLIPIVVYDRVDWASLTSSPFGVVLPFFLQSIQLFVASISHVFYSLSRFSLLCSNRACSFCHAVPLVILAILIGPRKSVLDPEGGSTHFSPQQKCNNNQRTIIALNSFSERRATPRF
jgi:hypothetical protein